MSYTAILNTEIDPDSPITTSLMFKLRDNPEAMIAGLPGAPRIARKALSIGGSGFDGNAVNGTSLTKSGYYDFETINWTAPKTLPLFTIIRCRGACNISSTITASRHCLNVAQVKQITGWNAVCPAEPATAGSTFVGGAGVVGRGANKSALSSLVQPTTDPSTLQRLWLRALRRPMLGAPGSGSLANSFDGGGGCIIIISESAINLTGAVLDASGLHTTNGNIYGSGGGGVAGVISSVSITGGTLKASGGSADDSGATGAGGGGGGYAFSVAPSYPVAPTFDVAAGPALGAWAAGEAGYSEQVTMAEEYINGFLLPAG